MDLVSQKKHIPEHYSEFCKPKPIIRIHILLGADDDHNLCFPYGALVMCFPMHKCYYFSALLKGESFSLPLSASLESLTVFGHNSQEDTTTKSTRMAKFEG